MPCFAEKPTHFDVTVEWKGETITVKVRWTPEADDKFACMFSSNDTGNLVASEEAAYRLLLDQAVTWENVLDKDGNPLPYSRGALQQLFGAVLKVRLIQRFISAVLAYTEESLANPS